MNTVCTYFNHKFRLARYTDAIPSVVRLKDNKQDPPSTAVLMYCKRKNCTATMIMSRDRQDMNELMHDLLKRYQNRRRIL